MALLVLKKRENSPRRNLPLANCLGCMCLWVRLNSEEFTRLGIVKITKATETVRIMSVVLLAVSMRHSLCFTEVSLNAAVLATEVMEAAWSKDLHIITSHKRMMIKGMRLCENVLNHPLM